jgi:DNA-binding transcriptional ArsR family regulator
MTETKGAGQLGQPLALFGNPTRTGVLLLLALIDESYPHELARLLGRSLSTVQGAVKALERDGALVTRRLGTERRITLNSRFYAAKALRALLVELAHGQPEIVAAVRSARRRPRRNDKPL